MTIVVDVVRVLFVVVAAVDVVRVLFVVVVSRCLAKMQPVFGCHCQKKTSNAWQQAEFSAV